MNNILLEEDKKTLQIKKDTIITVEKENRKFDINNSCNSKLLLFCFSSNLDLNINISADFIINIFSFDSNLNIKLNILKDNLNISYAYSTINESDNKYNIDIRHHGNNIKSKIINHGINITNKKLDFVINTYVPENKKNISTFQDSKIIIFDDMTATIKPNLYIDSDDIEAEHSAYIGYFKKEELFYLMTRGLNNDEAQNLLVKSFLIGNMNLKEEEKEKVLKNINRFWR